jgi:hypothetical protein
MSEVDVSKMAGKRFRNLIGLDATEPTDRLERLAYDYRSIASAFA